MKILVTGGAGFIGYNLTQMLLDQDHKVTVLDNFKSGTNTVDHNNVNYIKIIDNLSLNSSTLASSGVIVAHLTPTPNCFIAFAASIVI